MGSLLCSQDKTCRHQKCSQIEHDHSLLKQRDVTARTRINYADRCSRKHLNIIENTIWGKPKRLPVGGYGTAFSKDLLLRLAKTHWDWLRN